MAKQQSSDKELKKLIEGLYNAVQTMNENARESVKINRDLLKTMAILNSGFAQNEQDARALIEQVRNGAEVTDEFATKWAKQRKVAKEDIDAMIKKFRELELVDEDIIENSKDYIDLLKDRYDLLENEVDLSKRLLGTQEGILKIINQSKNAATKLTGAFDSSENVLNQIVSKKIDLSGFFDDAISSTQSFETMLKKIKSDIDGVVSNVSGNLIDVDLNFNPITNDLDSQFSEVLKNIEKEKSARESSLIDLFKMNTHLQTKMSRQMAAQMSGMDIKIDIDSGDIETTAGLLKVGTSEFEKLVEQLDEISNSNGILSGMEDRFSEIVNLVKLGSMRTEEMNRRLGELISPMDNATQIMIKQLETRFDQLEIDKGLLSTQKKSLELITLSVDKLKTSESIVRKVADGFDYINSLLPTGIGEFVGLSRVSAALMDSHKKGVQDFSSELAESADTTKAMSSYMNAFSTGLSGAISPMTALVVAGALLYKFVQSITSKYKELSSEMKISLGQSKKLYQVQLDTLTSQKNQFATMSDIKEIQTAMIGSSGKMFDLDTKDAKELSINLIEVGKYFGYGNEEAVNLHKTFKLLGANDKLSIQLQRNVGYMAEMAGLSPQIISQDLLDSAEEVSLYFAGIPEQAAKAVIQVRRMGMSLKQAGSIAQKMLNLESFMTDMYELQAMSGGGIDFSGAFDKGLMGDIEGMTKEIMDQIGTTADLNKMDFLTRKKIANTLGMTSDELSKSVMLREKMNGLDSDSSKYLDANLDRMGDISAMTQEDIRNKMQQLQSTDRLGVAWDKISGVLVDSLLPFVESFADGISAISPIIDIIMFGFKAIGGVIKLFAPLISGIFAPFKFVADQLSKITAMADGFANSLSGIKPILDILGKTLYWVGAGIGILFAPQIFMSVVGGIKNVLKFIPIIGSLFGSAGKSAKSSISSATDSIQEMATNVSISIGEMTDSIKSSMSSMADSIKQTFSEVKNGTATLSSTPDALVESVKKSKKLTSAATSEIVSDVESKVQKIKKSSKENNSLVNVSATKSAFKTVGDIGTKAIASWAVESGLSFLQIEKDGEKSFGMLGTIAGSLSPMLTDHLTNAMQKVFSKKLEDKISGTFASIGKKAGKEIGQIDAPVTSAFGRIFEKGKSMFENLTSFGKKAMKGSTVSMKGSFDNMAETVDKISPKLSTAKEITENVSKRSTETISKTTQTKKINLPDADSPIKTVGKKMGSGFDSITNIMKTVWNGLKTVLTDIVKFISNSMKELSSGIGTSIKNILKGIGDGLSSFKTSAIKGAAALVILSGALWISSKAIQNFASIKWEDVAKAGVAIGGLAAIALILGSASVNMIIGAAAIAILGASLIPTAYALKMFNDVDWASLGKATVALIAFGAIGTLMSGLAVNLIIGAAGIAIFGAAMIPMTFALEKFNKIEWSSLAKAGTALLGLAAIGSILGVASPLILAGSAAMTIASVGIFIFSTALGSLSSNIKDLNFEPMKGLVSTLIDLTSISIISLFGVAGGIGAISASLLAFNAMSGISSIISTMFGGNVVKDLQKLGDLADPLYIVNKVLSEMGKNLEDLSNALENIDFSNFDQIKKLGIDATINQKVQPRIQNNVPIQTSEPSRNYRISPNQPQVAQATRPDKVQVAQDKLITSTKIYEIERNERLNTQSDNYNQEDMVPDVSKTDMLLQKIIDLLTIQTNRPLIVQMDGQKTGEIIKKHFNK